MAEFSSAWTAMSSRFTPNFESVIPKAVDFRLIRGQDQAKEAAIIAA